MKMWLTFIILKMAELDTMSISMMSQGSQDFSEELHNISDISCRSSDNELPNYMNFLDDLSDEDDDAASPVKNELDDTDENAESVDGEVEDMAAEEGMSSDPNMKPDDASDIITSYPLDTAIGSPTLEFSNKENLVVYQRRSEQDQKMESNDECFNVICKEIVGVFHPTKFAAGNLRCINYKNDWMTPPQFEKLAGMGLSKKWRLSIRHLETNVPLSELQEAGKLFLPSWKNKKGYLNSIMPSGKKRKLYFENENSIDNEATKVKTNKDIKKNEELHLYYVSPEIYIKSYQDELAAEMKIWKKNASMEARKRRQKMLEKAKEIRKAQKMLNMSGPKKTMKPSISLKKSKTANSEMLAKALKESEKQAEASKATYDNQRNLFRSNHCYKKLKLISLRQRLYMNRHRGRHSKPFLYRCDQCRSEFTDQPSLSNHLVLFHTLNVRPVITHQSAFTKQCFDNKPTLAQSCETQTESGLDKKSLKDIAQELNHFREEFSSLKAMLLNIQNEMSKARDILNEILSKDCQIKKDELL